MVWAMVSSRSGGGRTEARSSRKLSSGHGALSPWGEKALLGVHQDGPVEALWAEAVSDRAREGGFGGRTALSGDGGVALGKRESERNLERSLGIGDLSRVRHAGDRVGGGTGTQGGSGHAPRSLEWRRAVDRPTRPCRGIDIGEIGVRRGTDHLRTEVSSDRPGGYALFAGTDQAAVRRR